MGNQPKKTPFIREPKDPRMNGEPHNNTLNSFPHPHFFLAVIHWGFLCRTSTNLSLIAPVSF